MTTIRSCIIDSGKELFLEMKNGRWIINPKEFNSSFKKFITDETDTKLNMTAVERLSLRGFRISATLYSNIVELILEKQLTFLEIYDSIIAARYFRRIMAALKKNPHVEVIFRRVVVVKREKKMPSKFFFKDMFEHKKMLQGLVGPPMPTHQLSCTFDLKKTKLSYVFLRS